MSNNAKIAGRDGTEETDVACAAMTGSARMPRNVARAERWWCGNALDYWSRIQPASGDLDDHGALGDGRRACAD